MLNINYLVLIENDLFFLKKNDFLHNIYFLLKGCKNKSKKFAITTTFAYIYFI